MGDFSSSTITDLRQLMMGNNLDSLAGTGAPQDGYSMANQGM